jgi:PAS domain S-box-containing protein
MKNMHNKSPVTQKTTQPESIEHEAEEHPAITDVDLLQDLLDSTPNRVYFKDINSHFILISKSQAIAFCLSDPYEAIGKSDFDFFTKEHAEQAYRDEQEIMQTGKTLTKEEKETWPDRPDTWVETTKMPLRDKKGIIIGTFGISKDITAQKLMEKVLGDEQNMVHALMDNLLDAIYFKDAESRFIRINQAHARWFGLSDPIQAVGKSDFDFFSEELSRQYYDDEQTIMLSGQPLVGKEENQTFPDGRVRWVSTTKMPLQDPEGKIIGTFGISRDITAEKHLRDNIDDLQKDVGRTFHTLSGTLNQAAHAITPTLPALGPDPFNEKLLPPTDQVWLELAEFRNILVSTIGKLLKSIDAPLQKDVLSPDDWAKLSKLLSTLKEVEKINIAETRVPVLRRAARQVIDILAKIKKGRLPQELVREVRRSAEHLERMACLVALHQVQDRIMETDYMVRDLRERVITGVKRVEESEIFEFWGLVKEAIKGLSDYADYKGIDLRLDNRADAAHVWVGQHDIIRVVNNLLHNAIKYSWVRNPEVRPWIEIRSYIKTDKVYVEIEDYGVPIPRDEIEGDLIFQLGWRGRLSGQRGRIGTGIGLSDARDTAKRYGGDVKIISRPATHDSSMDDLSVPHIKTATLYLPIHKA